jgi:uncharacterized protein (TIGR00297 family)
LELAAGIWALLAVGDGMAALSGLALRGPSLPWNPKKTWSGLAAFVLFGTAASAWVIRWVQRAGTLTIAGSFTSEGLLTLGEGDASGRIGDAFLLGAPESMSFLIIGCLVAATAAALAESMDTKADDNILVPVVGGGVLWLATLVDPLASLAGANGWLVGLAITVPITGVAYSVRAVDRWGAVVGVLLATVLYAYAGWPGLLMLGGVMVLGMGVTRMGHVRKEALGVAEGRGGRRGVGSVVANAGAGVAFAFLAAATPYSEAFTIAMVAAFATALFDTTATEVGQAFGRRHVLVTTWRAVPEGTTGGVSVVGTMAGFVGATVLVGVGWSMGLIAGAAVLAIIIGAFCGSTLESFLGAMMGKGSRTDHHLRNLANTVAGAGVAWGLVALQAYLGGRI